MSTAANIIPLTGLTIEFLKTNGFQKTAEQLEKEAKKKGIELAYAIAKKEELPSLTTLLTTGKRMPQR